MTSNRQISEAYVLEILGFTSARFSMALWSFSSQCALSLFSPIFGQSIIFLPFHCKRSTCRKSKENEVVKYQWAIHHGGVSKRKGHLLCCGDASVSCQRALNYRSISGAFKQRVKINTRRFISQSRVFPFQLHTDLIECFPVILFIVLSCFRGGWSLKRRAH